jgi:hypothetical protein
MVEPDSRPTLSREKWTHVEPVSIHIEG